MTDAGLSRIQTEMLNSKIPTRKEGDFFIFDVRDTRSNFLSPGSLIMMPGDTILPLQVDLEGAYPNPFDSELHLTFTINEGSKVEVSVFDLLGRRVALLKNGYVNAGKHSLRWDSSDANAGTYIVYIDVGVSSKSFEITKQ